MLEAVVGPLVTAARHVLPKGGRVWRLARNGYRCAQSARRLALLPVWRRRERVVDTYLSQLTAARPDVFVVQVGACDGVQDDPIRHWILERGWHGLLIEPQAAEFARLRANYAAAVGRLQFENVAIASVEGHTTLFRLKESAITHEWQRMVASVLPRPELAEMGTVEAVRVPCVPLQTLLDRHGIDRVDLLQIDVEGFDYEVIKMVDFNRVRPRAIRYEHRHLAFADRRDCRRLLTRLGYRVVEMEFDTCACT